MRGYIKILTTAALIAFPLTSFAADSVVTDFRLSSGSVTLPTPGNEHVQVTLSPISKETISIPVFNASGDRKQTIDVPVTVVTDFKGVTGIIAEGQSGAFGALEDVSAEKPVFYQISPQSDGQTKVERVSDVSTVKIENDVENVGVSSALPMKAEFTGPVDPSAWRAVQVMFVSPSGFTGRRSDEDVAAQLAQTVKRSNYYYEALKIRLVIAGLQIFRTGTDDPYAAAEAAIDPARAMLETAQQKWLGVTTPEHDIVAVLGRGYFKGYLGLAYPSTSCVRPEFAVAFINQSADTAQAELNLADTLAHELGHVLGMNHDNNVYPAGPSLMWAGYTISPFGFSARSIGEEQSYSGAGLPGGSCFSSIAVELPRRDLAVEFEDSVPQKITIREGHELRRTFGLRTDVAGVRFSAKGLPAGAVLDPLTGLLTYTPDFDMVKRGAKKQFSIILTAKNEFSKATKQIQLRVVNGNRAPVLRLSDTFVTANPGETVTITGRLSDPDGAKDLKLRFLSKNTVKRLPGKLNAKTTGTSFSFQWTIPADANLGLYRFTLSGTDGTATREYGFNVNVAY